MKGILRLVLRKVLIFSICLFFVQNSSATSSFTVLLDQNRNLFDKLDYYKSKEIVINLGDRQLSLDWGDIGHGDILKPFNGIKPKIIDMEVVSNNDGEDKFGAVAVGKKIAKAIFKKKVQELAIENLDDFLEKLPSFVRWIVEKIVKNGELSPVEEFVLRSYILFQTHFDSGKQALKTAEFMALLFRLALTEGQDILDVKNGLGSYLVNSEMINELLGQDFVNFVLDVLSSLQNGFEDCDFDSLGTIVDQTVTANAANTVNYKVGYVFKELDSAEQCYGLFGNKEYSEKEFKKIIASFIQNLTVDGQDIWSPKNYETVSVDKFRQYKNSTLNNFIGFSSNTDQILEFIPEDSVQQTSSNVNLISGNSEHWVVLNIKDKVSNADLSKIVKFTMAAIYKTFQDYKNVFNVVKRQDSSYKLEKGISLKEHKKKQIDLLKKKGLLKKELVILDMEIEKAKATLASGNNLWNKFFFNMNEDKLQNLLERREIKEERLSNIEREIKKLRIALYYLIDSEDLQNLSDKGFFAITTNMFLSNPRVKRFINDINQNPEYKSVKENLIKRLAKIFGQSDYVKEYWEIVEYVLSNLLPDYKNDFKKFAQNLNEQDGNDAGDMILSLIGL